MAATTKERNSRQYTPRDVDEQAVAYITNLEDNIRNMETMMVELDGGLTKIKSGIPVLKESLESKQALGQDFTKGIKEVNAKKFDEAEERVKRLEEEKHNVDWQLANFKQSIEKKENEISTLSNKLTKTEQELKSTQTRLSEVMGNKLMDNNPDIADLSDQHRPSKLAEKYSELYDNEWTDAFEGIQTSLKYDDKKCVKTLKDMLLYFNRLCTAKWQDYVHGFKEKIKRGQNFEVPDYINKQLKDITKSFAPRMIDDVFMEFIHESSDFNERSKSVFQSKGVQTYSKSCLEICWLMAAQDPPVVVKADYEAGDKMDTTILKAYTQNGDTIEFLVWPPLFLYERGPLLSKGVAQAVKAVRTQSAQANTKAYTKGPDMLLSPTTLIKPGNAWPATGESSPVTAQPQTHSQMETEDVSHKSVSVQGNQNDQQTNVNTGLQGQASISPTHSYDQQSSSYFNVPFGNKPLPVTSMTQASTQIGLMSSGNQQTHRIPTSAQQQQQIQRCEHIQWNNARTPSNREMERFFTYMSGYSESDARYYLGQQLFELCRDYNIYLEKQLLAKGSTYVGKNI